MLRWLGIDERIWKHERYGIPEELGSRAQTLSKEMCSEGIEVRTVVEGALCDETHLAEEGVVITMDVGLYESAMSCCMPVVWYWCSDVVPDGARYMVQAIEGVDVCYVRMVYGRKHGMPLTIAAGNDWILRECTETDEEAVRRCITAYPDVCMVRTDMQQDALADILRSYAQEMYGFYGYGMWLVTDRINDDVMGWFGLEHILREDVAKGSWLYDMLESMCCLQAGYMLLPQFCRRGIGGEVLRAVLDYGFTHAGAQCIAAFIRPGNEPSRKLAMRMGMEYVENTYYRNQPVMVYVCQRNDENWMNVCQSMF